MTWLDRLVCRLKQHPAAMLHFGEARLALRCPDCGWQSPGIEVREARPPQRAVVRRWPIRLRRVV